jgi:hypothetical protein
MGGEGKSSTGPHLHLGIYTMLPGKERYVGSGQKGWFDKSFPYVESKAYQNCLFYDPVKVIAGKSTLVSTSDYPEARIHSYPKAIVIECPVNVNVYDSKNNLAASIVNNEVIFDELLTIVTDDTKTIYLSLGDDYRIELTATDNGAMNYSISEIENRQNLLTRKVMMKDIPLTKGEVFTSHITTKKGTPSETYELASNTGKKYYADEELSGSDVNNITITLLSVVENGPVEKDYTFRVTKDDYTTIGPFEYGDDLEFDGWYENGIKIEGAGQLYSFHASVDRELVARFVPKNSDTGNTDESDKDKADNNKQDGNSAKDDNTGKTDPPDVDDTDSVTDEKNNDEKNDGEKNNTETIDAIPENSVRHLVIIGLAVVSLIVVALIIGVIVKSRNRKG